MQQDIDLSIIIVSYKVQTFLENCLTSIQDTLRERNIQYEVFVVDNNSRDKTVEMVRTKFSEIKLIANSINAGFAAANNQAIRKAKGQYVLLLNPDTIVRQNTIENVLNFFDKAPNAGIVGCKLLNADGSLQPSCMSFPSVLSTFSEQFYLYRIFPKSSIWGRPYMTFMDYNKEHEVDVIKGAFLMFRKNLIDQIGLLDERFFVYTEEVDWCYRTKKAGWNIYYTPVGEVIHLEGKSTGVEGQSNGQQNIRMFVELHNTKCQFLDKHYSKSKALVIKLIMLKGVLLRTFFWGILALITIMRRGKRKIYTNRFKMYGFTTLRYLQFLK